MTDTPYVVMNIAMTADGKTDTIARRGALISSPLDMMRVDQLRASCDAIMVGGHTLLGDDPRLVLKTRELQLTRLAEGKDENPMKVGVVTIADLDPDSRFLNCGHAKITIFTTCKTPQKKVEELRDRGVKVFISEDSRVDLRRAIAQLGVLGVKRLLVEGGGTLNEELIRLGLVDELNIYIAPLIFGGATAPTFASSSGFERKNAKKLELKTVQKYEDGGLVLNYHFIKY
jgi:2,5-diamino-6-(ribosylamino)-4(3H)-pyrimidinone 5'-phosphate reductase